MAVKAVIPILVAMMLLTGCCNTLLTKYQDMQCVHNCDDPDPKKREYFEQPVLQTAQMFIGEMGCWLVIAGYSLYNRFSGNNKGGNKGVYTRVGRDRPDDPLLANDEDETYIEGEESDEEGDLAEMEHSMLASSLLPTDPRRTPMTGLKVLLLALPALCDICGTTLMNVGLLFVAASIYQMTRGALVLFVGLFSVLFLKRHLSLYKWFALFVVVAGVAVVGLAGAIEKGQGKIGIPGEGSSGGSPVNETLFYQPGMYSTAEIASTGPRLGIRAADELSPALKTTIGVLLIAAAQIFTASQFVLEESIMEKYALEPLKAVGWEGLWGFVFTALGMVILHFTYGRTEAGRHGYFDAGEGLSQMVHNRAIAVTSILIMFSIGGFNFFGLSVTRTVSATSRSTIDTCRTLFIWVISLGLGWETFKWLQVAGFALLVYGTFLFNDIVRPPLEICLGGDRRGRANSREREDELFPERPTEHL